ncbi:hypothetical protein Tco_0909006 [Tanacetum coccineum]|uniref:Uncharacterized protein n=1 Tax=Tanacetum coccineum TaxID=301880 RepID=A0ABQ5CNR3_9ASTR
METPCMNGGAPVSHKEDEMRRTRPHTNKCDVNRFTTAGMSHGYIEDRDIGALRISRAMRPEDPEEGSQAEELISSEDRAASSHRAPKTSERVIFEVFSVLRLEKVELSGCWLMWRVRAVQVLKEHAPLNKLTFGKKQIPVNQNIHKANHPPKVTNVTHHERRQGRDRWHRRDLWAGGETTLKRAVGRRRGQREENMGEIPPYQYKFRVPDADATPATPGNDGTPQQPREEVKETFATVLEDIQKWITVEAEAVQNILTGIDNDIYSTDDACPNTIEMWKAIERLKQGESINVHDLETNLYWEFRKFTSQEGESLDSYYSRSQAAIRNRGNAIANSPPPTYDLEPKVVADDEASSKEKEIDKLMGLISMSFKKIYKLTNNNLRTSSNTRNTNVDNTPRSNRGTRENVGTQVVQQTRIQCFNYKEFGHVSREFKKAKRSRDLAYHKEKMMLCKQEEVGIQLSAEQADWRDDTDNKPEDQELEAHYMYMANIQEVTPDAAEKQHPEQLESVNDTYVVEQCDTNITSDSSDMSNNGEETDQDDQTLQKERELLVSLIEHMKIKIDGSKQTNKSLESSNKALREANTFLNTELKRYQDTDFVKNARLKCATAYGLLEE